MLFSLRPGFCASMRVCCSRLTACGHAQDLYSILKSPGMLHVMSITLLLAGFVQSYFTWRWWKEKGEQKALDKCNLNHSERRWATIGDDKAHLRYRLGHDSQLWLLCVVWYCCGTCLKGVHGMASIKKSQYWPNLILGKEIKAHFAEKEIGLVACWNDNLNDQAVTANCFKEPAYVMSIMLTCGTVNEEGVVKNKFLTTLMEMSKYVPFLHKGLPRPLPISACA
jgi:hypothetical protein